MASGRRLAQLVFWAPALQLLFGNLQTSRARLHRAGVCGLSAAQAVQAGHRRRAGVATPAARRRAATETASSTTARSRWCATPPSTAAGTVPNSAAVMPLSNWPSWLEALMNRKFTAPTRPRISSGVRSCTSEKRITTLTVSAAPRTASASNRQPHPVRQREHHRRCAEDDHRLEHAHAHAAVDGVARQNHGHQQRADRGRGAQHAEARTGRPAGCRARRSAAARPRRRTAPRTDRARWCRGSPDCCG